MSKIIIPAVLEADKYFLQLSKNICGGEVLYLGTMRKRFYSITQAQEYFNKFSPPKSFRFDINEKLTDDQRLQQKAFIFYDDLNNCNIEVIVYHEPQIFYHEDCTRLPSFDEPAALNNFLNDIKFIDTQKDLDLFNNYKEKIKQEQERQAEENSDKTFFEKQENYKEFLYATRVHSMVVTEEAEIGHKTRTGLMFRLSNTKFLLSYNGELFNKDTILENFRITCKIKNFVEKIKTMYVCHEETNNNKHTHIMIILNSKIDTKNENCFDIIYEFNKGSIQSFTPVIFIQSVLEQDKCKQLFDTIDKYVYKYVNPKQISDNTNPPAASVFSSVPTVNNPLASSSLNLFMNSQQLTLSLSNLPTQQPNLSKSNDGDDNDIKIQEFEKEYQNVLYREILNNVKLKTHNKTIFIFPTKDNSEIDYDNLSYVGSCLSSLESQKQFLIILAKEDEETFFNEIAKSINEKKWNMNTLCIYLEIDSENITENINLYNNIMKYIKKLRRGMFSSKKYNETLLIDLSLKIIVFFPKFLNKNDIKLYPNMEYRAINGDKFVPY